MRIAIACAAVVAALFLGGCGGDGETQQSPPPRVTSATPGPATTGPTVLPPSPPSGTPSPSRLPNQDEPLDPNGYYFGFIRSIGRTSNPSSLEFDVAEFLTGEEGLRAALEDGEATEQEGLPNDFYIRNRSTALRMVEVAPDVTISLISCAQDCMPVAANWRDLVRLLTEPHDISSTRFFGSPGSLFFLTLRNGVAVKLEEQYIP